MQQQFKIRTTATCCSCISLSSSMRVNAVAKTLTFSLVTYCASNIMQAAVLT